MIALVLTEHANLMDSINDGKAPMTMEYDGLPQSPATTQLRDLAWRMEWSSIL